MDDDQLYTRREGGIWRGRSQAPNGITNNAQTNNGKQSYRDAIQRTPSNVELRTNEGEHKKQDVSEGSQAQLGGGGGGGWARACL